MYKGSKWVVSKKIIFILLFAVEKLEKDRILPMSFPLLYRGLKESEYNIDGFSEVSIEDMEDLWKINLHKPMRRSW